MRLKLSVAYDGTPFRGWQSQPFGNTVQDVLEDALRRITGQRVVVHASSRTDTGVHALGQGAHIEVTERFSVEEWLRILNYNLPPAIRIMSCEEVPRTFDARLSATGKVYRYLIRNEAMITPHEMDRVWLIPQKLNVARLREAGRIFTGTHDFRGFCANREVPVNTVRTISRLTVVPRGTLIAITFQGEGFLYHMVRMITASMVRVAQGEDSLAEIESRLHGPGAPIWSHVAPPSGLYLVKVLYGKRRA